MCFMVHYRHPVVALTLIPSTWVCAPATCEHKIMGSVCSTQIPGLLCGFYSKITIPESNRLSTQAF